MAADDARHGRRLTEGEIALLRGVYGNGIAYDRVRLFSRPWMPIFPRNRGMAPNGNVYMPGNKYADDYASPGVPLGLQAVFVHEGAHLYQWYGLGWIVWLRGPFARNYRYRLVPGRRYAEYGLEQMGMIAQHWFILASGGRPAGLPDPSYTAASYAHLLPAR